MSNETDNTFPEFTVEWLDSLYRGLVVRYRNRRRWFKATRVANRNKNRFQFRGLNASIPFGYNRKEGEAT